MCYNTEAVINSNTLRRMKPIISKLDLNQPPMPVVSSGAAPTPSATCHTPNKKLISSSSKHSHLNLQLNNSHETGENSVPSVQSQLHSILKHTPTGKMPNEPMHHTMSTSNSMGKIKSDKRKDSHAQNHHQQQQPLENAQKLQQGLHVAVILQQFQDPHDYAAN
jgi:hypothetical protein